MKLAIVLLAFGCRTEATEQRQPLKPSGQPVAQREDPPRDPYLDRAPDEIARDLDDQLPPSLYEQENGGMKDKKKKDKDPPPLKPAEPWTEPTPAKTAKSTRIAPISKALCVTTGAAKLGEKVDKPAMRAVAKGTDGEAAALTFTFQGETAEQKKLASGDLRRQLGLKLRAENGCNLIYVMWRLDPKPMIYVQTKQNPGAKDHKACGTNGYKKVKPSEQRTPPELKLGEKHTLRAEITDNTLSVFVDDELHWRGTLPDSARSLRGPAGIRSDNLAFDLVSFDATTTGVEVGNAKCVSEDND
jgi:hypothetical protein